MTLPVTIIPYHDKHQPIFRSLNESWLDEYNLKEPRDLEVLENPRGEIIDKGGSIFLAEWRGEIIGSAALMKEHDGVYELVKMGVVKSFQGQGVSKLLLEACLEHARLIKAKKLILFSNHQLKAALGLYEKYGFAYIEVEDSPFLTADVKMELVF